MSDIMLPGNNKYEREGTWVYEFPHNKYDVLAPHKVTIDEEKFKPYHMESEEN